jgi:Tfp pilus assembly protein PilN
LEWLLDLPPGGERNKTMIRINLLKPEAKELPAEEARREIRPPKMSLIYLLVVFAAAALFFYQRSAFNKEGGLLEDAQAEKNKLSAVLGKLEEAQELKGLFERKISLINQIKPRQQVAVRIMDELSKHIPFYVWLSEATYDKQKIHIKGRALSNNLIADYIYSLETSPYFFNVNLLSSTQRTTRDNRYLEFALNATYVAPPAAESLSGEDLSEVVK